MAIADDFRVYANGDIRYTGGSTNYTVIEFHRYLQALADDAAAAGDDLIDITDTTPSERSTDNIITLLSPYNIDTTAATHLYDGSITQSGGDEVYSGLVVVGAVETGTQLQIVQNNTVLTSYWSTGLNADAAANILLRIMVRTRLAGSDIDGKRIRVQARELGNTYSEFSSTLGQGNSTAAIFTAVDLNNQTSAGTIAGWTSITNTEGLRSIDVNIDGTNELYYSEWNKGSQSINDVYERTKWIQRRGTSETIHGLNGFLFRGITHQVAYTGESSGPFVEDEIVTWGTGATAGTGKLLALKDDGTTGTLWLQLLTGVAPSANTLNGPTNSTTATASTVTARTISPAFIGQSTGSAIIGAYGIGFEAADLSANDKVFDLTNTQITPPNYVTFTVNGLISTEDRVLVGPESGGTFDTDQFLGATGQNANGAATYVCAASIPTDTPASGTIRVFNGSTYDRVPYTSYSGSTFTLTGTLPNDGASHYIAYDTEVGGPFSVGETLTFTGGETAELLVLDDSGTTGFMTIRLLTGSAPVDNDDMTGGTSSATAKVNVTVTPVGGFISYIDLTAAAATATFTSVFSSTRSLYVRVRDGGGTPIKTFETTASLTSAGGSTTAIRTSDA